MNNQPDAFSYTIAAMLYVLVVNVVASFIFKPLWNSIMPRLFAFPEITFKDTLVFSYMISIVVGVVRGTIYALN